MNTTSTTDPYANVQQGVARSLRHMVDEADQFLKAAGQSGDATIDTVRDKMTQQVRRMRMQLDEMQGSSIHKARRAARTTDLAIQNHPYRAIGIAAAAALLIGFLAARR